jgi:uncharacterized protein (DUF2384 family)
MMDEPYTYLLRLTMLKRLLLQLYEPAEVDAWLLTPQSYLQDRRPVDLLDTEIGYLEVSAVVHRVLDGAYV